MEFLYNSDTVNEIVEKLFRHRRNDYSQFVLENLLAYVDLPHQILPVYNQNYEKLYVSLFQTVPQSQVCIVFMHGYGSNRLECCNILKALKEHYSLCAFDFSGSGKSQGDRVTYGVKQKQDINCTLNFLRKAGFKKFILWGRSMGATSALLYCTKYKPNDVILQIVDSAFYSFEMIAFQIANKNVKAPQFLISFALQMAKKNCCKFENNPFNINLQNVGQCTVPAVFLYCQEDNVINYHNTQKICAAYRSTFEKLVIRQNHNVARTQSTLQKIFSFINKYVKRSEQKFPQNLEKVIKEQGRIKLVQLRQSITSQSDKNRDKSGKKGIERVANEKRQACKKYDDYGIWVASKPKFHMPKTTQTPQGSKHSNEKFKMHTSKRLQLSLSSSFSVRNEKSEKAQFGQSPSLMVKHLEKEYSVLQDQTFERCQGEQLKSKLTSVRSIGGSRYLSNSKYL